MRGDRSRRIRIDPGPTGPDPLRADADPSRAWERIHSSRAPIGLLLMDQSVIAGIGNIYRSEILHLLKIHPRTPGEQITRKQFDQLWTLAKRLLELGVKHNRIITIDEKDLPKNVERTPRNKLFSHLQEAALPHLCRRARTIQAGFEEGVRVSEVSAGCYFFSGPERTSRNAFCGPSTHPSNSPCSPFNS
jgi:formamidopyrimidine-DNA glycosylase